MTPKRALEGMTPEEAWSRNKPDVSCLRIFGAQAFVSDIEKLGASHTARVRPSLAVTFGQVRWRDKKISKRDEH